MTFKNRVRDTNTAEAAGMS